MHLRSTAAVAVQAAVALTAPEKVLQELGQQSGRSALALNIRDVHISFETLISVPVRTDVKHIPGHGRNEWHIGIRAASTPHLYPVFAGDLGLVPVGGRACELEIAGAYRVPFGSLGRALDATLFSGIAEQTMRRFIRDIANRVVALLRWANLG